MTVHSKQTGFTLIELMIVVAIIGILAAIASSSYETYTVRAQVTEGIKMATNAKATIVASFLNRGEAPANRAESGMTANATDTSGNYVTSVEVVNGRVDITFGNRASATISGLNVRLVPYESPNLDVVWVCGNATPPALGTMGTSSGGNAATYAASTVPNRYLPSSCRP